MHTSCGTAIRSRGKSARCSCKLSGYVVQLIAKTLYAALLQPAVALFLTTPFGCRWVETPVRKFLRMNVPPSMDLDYEWSNVGNRISVAICTGLFIPVLLPVSVLGLWTNLEAIKHRCQFSFGNVHQDSTMDLRTYKPFVVTYILVAHVILVVFALLFFYDNLFPGRLLVWLVPLTCGLVTLVVAVFSEVFSEAYSFRNTLSAVTDSFRNNLFDQSRKKSPDFAESLVEPFLDGCDENDRSSRSITQPVDDVQPQGCDVPMQQVRHTQ